MSAEFPQYGTPEFNETVGNMAGEAVRGYYSFLNLEQMAAEMGDEELAALLASAAAADQEAANTLLNVLNPENNQTPNS